MKCIDEVLEIWQRQKKKKKKKMGRGAWFTGPREARERD